MTRIIKIRTIPRGYVEEKELKGSLDNGKTPAEWFMALYGKFGNPQDGGVWSYLLRHNNIVVRVTATDKDIMDYNVWVSPGFVLDARRKRTKVMNIIARRLNEQGVVFMPESGEDSLYYAVRRKNAELMTRRRMSLQEITDTMNKSMTDEERDMLYGGLMQYVPEVRERIDETIKEIFDE